MKINEEKDILLNTYMHKLSVSKRLSNRFDPARALTLREFIKLNPFLRYETDGFIGPSKEEYYFFHKQSLLWKNLKEFLLNSGFTPKDWAMLISDEKINRRKNLSLLNKEQILLLSISIISPGSCTSNKMFDITVADLLKKEFAPYDKQTITMQKILRKLGFCEEDGDFMKICKKDSKNTRLLKRKRESRKRCTYSNFGLCT